MRIRHFLYNSFLIENGKNKIAIDPGQYFWIFNFSSLIPKTEWKSITHILITHGDPDHHWQSDRVAGASNAPVVCGKDLAKVEDGKTLLVDPRGKGLPSWVPVKNAHPLDIGDSVILGDVEIEAVKSVHGPISVPILWFRIKKQPGPGERVGIGSVGFKITLDGKTIVKSYCQMLCMALGGDPVFNNAIYKLYAPDYFSKSLRTMQFDPPFLSTSA